MTKSLPHSRHPSTSLRMTTFVALNNLLLRQPLDICRLLNCRNHRGFDLHHSLRKTSYDRDFSLDKSKVYRYIYEEAVPTGFISTGLLS